MGTHFPFTTQLVAKKDGKFLRKVHEKKGLLLMGPPGRGQGRPTGKGLCWDQWNTQSKTLGDFMCTPGCC